MDVTDEFIEKNSWMVRPCRLYKEEYKDCKSMRSRFYQYFIDGELSTCNQWKRDHINCEDWKDNKNRKAFKELIESEEERRRFRMSRRSENDVWKERKVRPPPGWSDPLPEFIQERIKHSYLSAKSENEGKEQSLCSIS